MEICFQRSPITKIFLFWAKRYFFVEGSQAKTCKIFAYPGQFLQFWFPLALSKRLYLCEKHAPAASLLCIVHRSSRPEEGRMDIES